MKKLLLPVLFLTLILSGCTTTPVVEDTTVKVTLINEDSSEELTVEKGTLLNVEEPVKDGYTFKGWYEDINLTTKFDETKTIDSDITLYAGFDKNEDKLNQTILFFFYGEIFLGGMYVFEGATAEIPTLTFSENELVGWYYDQELTQPVTEIIGTSENQKFYAKLEPVESTINLEELEYYNYLNENNPVVTITVENVGVMTLQLFPDVAPNTVNNFIKYIQQEDYSDTIFHRVIQGFMIQGGQVETNMCAIEGEFSSNGIENNLKHTRGVISMARTNVMNSATSQFFIMHQDSPHLDGAYAGFGGLTTGFDYLDLIASVQTNDSDYPLATMKITSITVELNGYVPSEPVCAE